MEITFTLWRTSASARSIEPSVTHPSSPEDWTPDSRP